MHRFVEVEPGVQLWVHESGDPNAEPLLLVMGAKSSGLTWPEPLLNALGERHRVVIYDHRDTGRSSWAFDSHPYPISRLADDAVAVLDALNIERAHVAGMSLGGTLAQLLLLDHPRRLITATMWSTGALGGAQRSTAALPGPDPALLALWEHLADPRDEAAELDWRVEHWRVLRGDGPFDADEFRRMEQRIIAHAGRYDDSPAHAQADLGGLDRGAELASVRTPTLVINASVDPVYPPPHAAFLAEAIPGAELVTVPGLGHAIGSDVQQAVADAILRHTTDHSE